MGVVDVVCGRSDALIPTSCHPCRQSARFSGLLTRSAPRLRQWCHQASGPAPRCRLELDRRLDEGQEGTQTGVLSCRLHAPRRGSSPRLSLLRARFLSARARLRGAMLALPGLLFVVLLGRSVSIARGTTLTISSALLTASRPCFGTPLPRRRARLWRGPLVRPSVFS